MPAYNLFRHKQGGEVYCAVPEDCVFPPFVTGDHWEFGCKLDNGEAPVGFNREAARTGIRFNGFYLFHGFTLI